VVLGGLVLIVRIGRVRFNQCQLIAKPRERQAEDRQVKDRSKDAGKEAGEESTRTRIRSRSRSCSRNRTTHPMSRSEENGC
jgi:hypothetical protein